MTGEGSQISSKHQIYSGFFKRTNVKGFTDAQLMAIKSKLVELITLTLGEYACNLPVALLTQKRKASGAASPEMARTRGKRFCVMQEPDVNETLNVGEM